MLTGIVLAEPAAASALRRLLPARRVVDAVALALVSAACFGAMPVAVRFALVPPLVPAAVGALLMQIATFAVLCVAAAIQGGVTLDGARAVPARRRDRAGALEPLHHRRRSGRRASSRASVAFGVAPLFAVTLAVLVFDERPGAAVLVGALLIVARRRRARARAGAAAARPHGSGSRYALAGAALFALRDNLVRDLSLDTDVPSMTAGAAMLAASLVVTSAFVVAPPEPRRLAAARRRAVGCSPARSSGSRTSRSSRPSIAARSRSSRRSSRRRRSSASPSAALFLRRAERVGPRIVLGAALVVTGGALIAVFR